MRPKQRSALTNLLNHSTPSHRSIRSYYFSGTRNLLRRYTEIYRHLPSKCFKNCCRSWGSTYGTAPFLEFFFFIPNRNMFAEKILK